MWEFSSLIFILMVFLVSSYLLSIGNYEKKRNLYLIGIALGLPILLATFRYGVGTDYFNYYRIYLDSNLVSFSSYVENNNYYEILNFVFLKLSYFLGSYNVLLLIYSSITIIFFYLSISNHKDKVPVALSFFVFLSFYYPVSLNLMQQFAAVSVVVFAFKYIFIKNIKIFTLLILAASLIHTTAILVLPMYFFWSNGKEGLIKKRYWIPMLLLLITLILNYQQIIEFLGQYRMFEEYLVYSETNVEGLNRDFILKVGIFSIFMLLSKKLIRYDSRNQLYLLMLFFSIVIGITGFSSPWVKRLSYYFEVVQIFLIPSLLNLLILRHEKNLATITIGIAAIVYFTFVFYILGQSNIIPYEINWFQNGVN